MHLRVDTNRQIYKSFSITQIRVISTFPTELHAILIHQQITEGL